VQSCVRIKNWSFSHIDVPTPLRDQEIRRVDDSVQQQQQQQVSMTLHGNAWFK